MKKKKNEQFRGSHDEEMMKLGVKLKDISLFGGMGGGFEGKIVFFYLKEMRNFLFE